ncbi:sensor histidine kinase [Paenibacillus sp. GCM10027626]|uniref:sensor histidine kinase n=1 Tax=Paenibacillus sp. GCM10027626 TaxID=3273411 RepID=UPI00362B901E
MKASLNPVHMPIVVKLLATLLFVILSLFVISLLVNRSGENLVKAEIVKSMESKVDFYLDLLESDLSRTVGLQQALTNDDDLNRLSLMSQIMTVNQKREAMIRVQKYLSILRNSSKFVQSATAFIPVLERSISSADFVAPIRGGEYEAMKAMRNPYEYPFIYWDGRLFISQASAPIRQNGDPPYLLSVEISKAQLHNMLQELSGLYGGGALLVSNYEEWVLEQGEGGMAAYARQWLVDSTHRTGASGPVSISGQQYLATYAKSQALGVSLLVYAPQSAVMGSLTRFNTWLWILLGFFIVIAAAVSFLIIKMIHRPLIGLIRAFRQLEMGNLQVAVSYRPQDEFGYFYNQFNRMVNRLNGLIDEVFEQRYRTERAELKQLQSQIDPHFLYNGLFILHRLAKVHDTDNIVRFTGHLRDYFQYITRNANNDVSLQEEVRHAWNYAEVQGMRFGSKVEISFGELPEEAYGIKVPRLFLQPLIENSFRHALERRLTGGILQVAFELRDTELIIVIEDNGGITDEEAGSLRKWLESEQSEGETTGMINVHKRLILHFGKEAGLRLTVGQFEGLRIEIHLPVRR